MLKVCGACRFANPPDANFCAGCGIPLGNAAGPASPDTGGGAQRRQITVLFADLVGSTRLATRLDPEDLRNLIHRYQRVCSEVVARYEGHVAQYLGDGVVVYFGFPHAHEDDPTRATRAGLEIVQRLAAESQGMTHRLQARVGIATGTVVVDEHHGPGTVSRQAVTGESPNLAARLQELAPPGAVVIPEVTRRLLGGQFKYADLGPVRLKGFADPVHVYRVLTPVDTRIRFDATRGRYPAPLVGRDEELDWLCDCWEQAREGRGRVVLIQGPAGVGKSRLCKALSSAIQDRAFTRIRLQCSPYHTASPLHPLIGHLERAAGIRPGDSPQVRLQRLEAILTHSTDPRDETLPLIASLLSIPGIDDRSIRDLTPLERRERTLRALVDQLEALARHRPVYLQVEDTHWIDPTSRELLQTWMDRCADLPVLTLITFRPEIPFPAPDLPHVHPLHLRRLRMEESRTLARLVAGRPLENSVLDEIALRADGIPLYVEEVTRSVVHATSGNETGAPSLRHAPVPASLKDALTERLDRLGPAREVVQLCAVIGREVPFDLLSRISGLDEADLDDALERLVDSGILFRSRRRERGWGDFIFKHALLRDTAYESLLLSRRRHLHLQVARTMERHFPEQARRHPELLATHYGEGGEPAEAAAHWGRAALEALSRSANSEVILHVEQALAQLQRLPASAQRMEQELRFQVLLGGARRAASGFASEEMRQAFEAARVLCERIGERAAPVLIDVLRGLYSYHYARGELGQACELARQVVELAERCNPASLTVGLYMLGGIEFWQGEFEAAERTLTRAWQVYDRSALPQDSLSAQTDPGAFALFQLSWTQWMLGRPERAMQTARDVLAFSQGLHQPFTHSMTLFWVGTTALCCGHREEAARLTDEMLALTERHRLRYLRACALVLKGHVQIENGHPEPGIASVDRAMADFAAQGAGLGTAWALSKPIEVHIRAGRHARAAELLATARAAIAHSGERHWAPEIERLSGELALYREDTEQARTQYHRALHMARELGATALELRAAISLAAAAGPDSTEERLILSGVLERIEGTLATPDTEAAQLLLTEAQDAPAWEGGIGRMH